MDGIYFGFLFYLLLSAFEIWEDFIAANNREGYTLSGLLFTFAFLLLINPTFKTIQSISDMFYGLF
jgi:hypothetical protein